MANVQIIQRHAHLAGPVRLGFVNGREGRVAKAVFTAISNSRRGSGDAREDEATAIQWTVWGKLAENAAEYLGKGSHVNIVGRVRNNKYEKDGATVFAMDFVAEEIDYLESRAESQARRARDGGDAGGGAGGGSEGGDPDAGGGHDNHAPGKPGKAQRSRLPRADRHPSHASA